MAMRVITVKILKWWEDLVKWMLWIGNLVRKKSEVTEHRRKSITKPLKVG